MTIKNDVVAWAGVQDSESSLCMVNPFNGLFNALQRTIENGHTVTCSKHKEGAASEEQTEEGLLFGHEYGVMGLCEIKDSNGKVHRLVQTKNPHGHGEWNGRYHDGDTVWDDPAMKTYRRKVVGIDGVVDDGVAIMSFNDFRQQFTKCDVSDSCLGSEANQMNVKQVTGMITEEFCGGELEWHSNPKFNIRLVNRTAVTVTLNQPNTKIIGLDEYYETAMGFRIIMVLDTGHVRTSNRREVVDEGIGGDNAVVAERSLILTLTPSSTLSPILYLTEGDDSIVAERSSVTIPDKVSHFEQVFITRAISD